MQNLLALFQRHQIDLFLVGRAARNFIRHQDWGAPGILEYIALAPRPQVQQLEGLPLLFTEDAQRGPVVVRVSLDDQDLPGYITCVPPGSDPQEALKQALLRRGFCIEALALDAQGELIDPLQAQVDLDASVIQAVPEQAQPFGANALHFLRMAALVSELGVPAPRNLQAIANKQATKILYSSRIGWFREITSLLCGVHAPQGLQLLYDTRLLGLLLPEVHGMVGFAESSRYHHKDLWDHTCQVVSQAHPTPLVRWAALLHDVGKIWTRTYGSNRDVHFFQHDELGAILIEGIGERFHMQPDFQEHLAFLVRHHLRPNAYQSSWSDAAVRRLIRDAGPLLQPLLRLSRADLTSGIAKRRRQAELLSHELQQRITHLLEEASKRPPLPKGIGNSIIESFALQPGPQVGQIKQHLEQQIEAGHLDPHQECDYYIEYLRTLPALPGAV